MAVTVTLDATPAVTEAGMPVRSMRTAVPPTATVTVPVTEGADVSVTVRVRLPVVRRTTPAPNLCTPASAAVKV